MKTYHDVLAIAQEKGMFYDPRIFSYVDDKTALSIIHRWLLNTHKSYVDVGLLTVEKTFPLWTYRIDFLTPPFEKHGVHWLVDHKHAEAEFPEGDEMVEWGAPTYDEALTEGLYHALSLIETK